MNEPIYAAGQKMLILGRKGENGVRRIIFDVKEWAEEFGAGTLTLAVRRPDDEEALPVASQTGNTTLVWTITNADTAQEGRGEAELIYTVNDVEAKSEIWTTQILRSIRLGGDEPPEPYEEWVDTVIRAGARATESAVAAGEYAVVTANKAELAEQSATTAEIAKAVAVAAQVAAETAQGLAEIAQTGAETAKTGAETARTGAQNAQTAAEAAQGAAETAKTAAETAKTGAETAQAAAEAAQAEAEAQADRAEAAAETVTSSTDDDLNYILGGN